MRIFIAGGTGTIGRRLTKTLTSGGHEVLILTRNPVRCRDFATTTGAELIQGDGCEPGPWCQAMAGVDAVINLAGSPILDSRWTKSEKALIHDSRVKLTHNLVVSMGALRSKKPQTFISGSAIGFYGTDRATSFTEQATCGEGFLAQMTAEWEQEALAAAALSIRTVVIRIGVVLDPDGGMLARLLPLFRLGLGATIGDGNQWLSWIHRDDLCRIFQLALDDHTIVGPINGTAPQPVTNRSFCETLAMTLKRPCRLKVPASLLKLTLGEASQILLEGQRVVPTWAGTKGFRYNFPTLQSALTDLFVR